MYRRYRVSADMCRIIGFEGEIDSARVNAFRKRTNCAGVEGSVSVYVGSGVQSQGVVFVQVGGILSLSLRFFVLC
jgi:hypothetical protein